MNETVETFEFHCRCAAPAREVNLPARSMKIHLLLGILTLGVWFVCFAVYRMVQLYRLSRCPSCRRHAGLVFWVMLVMLLVSLEFGRIMYYFLIAAPERIVADASMAELPEHMRPDDSIDSSNIRDALGYVWITVALPSAGMFISANWPYLVLAWLSVVTIVGMALPSFYYKRKKET